MINRYQAADYYRDRIEQVKDKNTKDKLHDMFNDFVRSLNQETRK